MIKMLDELKKAFFIAKKDLKEYYFKPPTISWGIMFPIVFVFAFLIREGNKLWLIPGLLTLSIFFGTTSMSAASIIFERRMESFDRLLLFPISYYGIALGKTLSSFFFGLLSSAITLATIWILFPVPIHNILLLTICIIGSALQFSSIGVLLSFAVKDPMQSMTVFNSIRFPIIFLSNMIIPIKRLPAYMLLVPLAIPVTYSVESIRYSLLGTYDIVPPTISITIIFASYLAFLYITGLLIRKNIP